MLLQVQVVQVDLDLRLYQGSQEDQLVLVFQQVQRVQGLLDNLKILALLIAPLTQMIPDTLVLLDLLFFLGVQDTHLYQELH